MKKQRAQIYAMHLICTFSKGGLPNPAVYIHSVSIIGIVFHGDVSSTGSSETHRSHLQVKRNEFFRCWRRVARSVYCVRSKYDIQHSSPLLMSRDAVNTIRP